MSELFLEKIRALDKLISRKSTGTPLELATKMRTSVRCVHKYIGLMKRNGAPIRYSRKRRTYLYHTDGRFYCEFLPESNIILVLLLILSMTGFAQPENKIRTADTSIQPLLNWRIVGPFKDTLKNIRDLGSLRINTRDTAQRMIDTIYHQEKDGIDLEALFKSNGSGVGYAICKVYSAEDQEMLFFINVDDAMRCWVNDHLVLSVPGFTPNGRVIRKAYLKRGVNILTAEIKNIVGGWSFDIAMTTNKNAQDITAAFLSVAPPENRINEEQPSKAQLMNWRIIGPFSTTLENIDLNTLGYLQSIPENARQKIIDISYRPGKDGIDLRALFGPAMNGLVYAVCDVVSAKDQELAFFVTVDDAMRLWINGSQALSIATYTIGGAVFKKLTIKKGVSHLMVEVRNKGGDWFFDIASSGFEYAINNALLPGLYASSEKFIIPEGDGLSLSVIDPDFVPIKNVSTVKIFDARNTNCYTARIDLTKNSQFALPHLPPGAYRYELYTDRDTLSDYFCYGSLDTIYSKEKLAQKYAHNKVMYDALLPYIKRLDRLLGDYEREPTVPLSKKIVYCIYKVKEIDSAYQNSSLADLNSRGLSIRMFTSAIEHGEEYYLLYIPEKLKKQQSPIPLVVIVPYVTNNHPFYTGSIIANTERITYISKFAERYGMAVCWPSARIFKWYNQTPIITKSIIESIEDVSRHYNIDKKHCFLYGDCSGGLFALQTAMRRPDLFAAIAVEGPELTSVKTDETAVSGILTNNLFALTENLYGKPVFVLHSANDQKAPVELSFALMDSIKSTGGAVYYDDLNNMMKGGFGKQYSEPETMRKIFSFFNTQRLSSPGPVKKIATYGFYNDTVYGVFVKEKKMPGKATVSYQVKNNRLDLTAGNVHKLVLDTKKMDLEDPANTVIYCNGKKLAKGIDYKTAGRIIELTDSNASKGSNAFTKEIRGPLNTVFLNSFAIVRPAKGNEKIRSALATIDSLWVDEYRNHVLIIEEKQVDSAKRKGVNLIYFVNDIRQVAAPVLKQAGIAFRNESLLCKRENLGKTQYAFAFYYRDNNHTDNMYVGVNTGALPWKMLQSLFIKKGWYDYELWHEEDPIFQSNYED